MSEFLQAGADRGGAIAAANVAQDVAVSNPWRRGMTFQNTSDTAMWLSESGAVAVANQCFSVPAGGYFIVSTNARISVLCASAGKTFEATEY